MTEYYVVGDVHGNVSFASAVMRAAAADGVHHIFQVGDFGVWDHQPDGKYFLDKVNENAEKRDVYWWVTLGNHENYDSIERYQKEGETDGNLIKLRDRITVLGNKSAMIEVDGLRVASCGGAYSIDKAYRTEGSSWWRQEKTTYGDVERLRQMVDAHGQPHILLTHDSPSSLPIWNDMYKQDWESKGNREMMDEVWKFTRPGLWIHGHYHRWLEYRHNETQVVGLARDGEENSVVTLRNDDGDISYSRNNEWMYS